MFCSAHYEKALTVWSGSYCYDDACGCFEAEAALQASWDEHNSGSCDDHSALNLTCADDAAHPGYCVVDCAHQFYGEDGCSNKVINASAQASSLILNCGGGGDDGYGGASLGLCQNTRVHCPEATDTECVVNCAEDDSCAHMKISSENQNKVRLNCSNYGSCEFTQVVAPRAAQLDVFYGLELEATYAGTVNLVCSSSEHNDGYDANNYY